MGAWLMSNTQLPRSHLLYGKRIAIVGGGPAGLTLARLLQLSDVEVQVYERDSSPHARNQGGSLDLHVQSGQLAMRRCGLLDRFHMHARIDAQAVVVYNKHADLQLASPGIDEGESKPEIDRGHLLELLRTSLADDTVIWERRLQSVADADGGSYLLTFEKGPPVTADLVVGCDGIGSSVRAFLGGASPRYTGVTFVETRLADADSKHPAISRMVGAGSALSLGNHKGLLAQRNSDGSIRLYVALRVPEHGLRDGGTDLRDPTDVRSALLAHFDDWSPELVRMLNESDDHFLPWPLYAAPLDVCWETGRSLTLIGDSAHAMPPFLGAGANMALLDAVELAEHLTSDRYESLTTALNAFEVSMIRRMKPMIEQAVATQEILFADDAPCGLVDLMRGSLRDK